MKIRYIAPDLYNFGGIQSYAKTVYDYFKKNKSYCVEINNFIFDLPSVALLILKYLPHRLRLIITDRFIFPHLQTKNRYQNSDDLVQFWHADPAVFASKSIRFIVNVHGHEILPAVVNKNWYRKEFYPDVFEKAIKIVCTSKYTQNLFIRNYPSCKSKTCVIYPPIKMATYKSMKISDPPFYTIGTLSRLVKRKNVHKIIEALSKLYQRIPNFKYLLCGQGPEQSMLIEKLSSAPFLWEHFPNLTDDEKFHDFYSKLDVFVLPTVTDLNDAEGFGIVYLEANSFGVPVVASSSGGVTEAVSNMVTGVFANPNSSEDIALKIEEVLKKQFDRKQIILWAEKFSQSVIGKQYEILYQSIEND